MNLTLNDYLAFNTAVAGYKASDQDVDSSDSDIRYYGHVGRSGEWYIMRQDNSVSGDANVRAWRFAKGSSAYSTNWTGREALSYELFNVAFA